MRCLARRDPSLHIYGAHLLAETEEYRRADSERKKGKNFHGIPPHSALSVESVESPPSTSITDSTSIYKDLSVPPVVGTGVAGKPKPKKKNLPADSTAYLASKFFWQYLHEWAPQAIEPSESGYQSWALDLDRMFRIDGRTPEDYNDLLEWIDQQKPDRSGFLWKNNIHSPGTLRERWAEGKLRGFIPAEHNVEGNR